MNRRQLWALLSCSLINWWTGLGLSPLLPIYAVEFEASPAMIGTYLSFSFLALAIGTTTAGWLSSRLQRRKALIVFLGLLAVPLHWVMGHVVYFWQLVLLTAATWFIGGALIVLVSILAGLSASPTSGARSLASWPSLRRWQVCWAD